MRRWGFGIQHRCLETGVVIESKPQISLSVMALFESHGESRVSCGVIGNRGSIDQERGSPYFHPFPSNQVLILLVGLPATMTYQPKQFEHQLKQYIYERSQHSAILYFLNAHPPTL